jgi:hypothetical protein
MRKLQIVFTTLCLVAVLSMALPSAAYADDSGSQGGANSTTTKPKAPPPGLTWAAFLALLGSGMF